jgi:uncharacterized SAM-binding protein YcdF (DUF218 family)
MRIHPFLATTHREDTKILVVEGWLESYALRAAVAEFNSGSYERIFTTGGPIVGDGGYINDYRTLASASAGELEKYGMPASRVQMVPSHVGGRDRTYQSAVALRTWLQQNKVTVHSINLLTEDAHARRSRLLFQMALGDDVKVGIISIANPDYDPAYWWRYSAGVREILGETFAYVYAKFFFYP